MLKAIGYVWPILAIVLIDFTMWITVNNQVPVVADVEGLPEIAQEIAKAMLRTT